MKIKNFLLLGMILVSNWSSLQAQITIEECYQKTRDNYPLIKQLNLLDKTSAYTLSNISKAYLPQIDISAKATYQSDVTEVPLDFSKLGINGVSIPSISKDQYGVSINASQLIWDGGAIHSQRNITKAKAKVDMTNVEVGIYTLRQRVNELFFGILLTNEQLRQNSLYQQQLERNYNQMLEYKAGGIANQSDVDAVKISLLRAKQTKIAIESNKKSFTEMLSLLTGMAINDSTKLQMPSEAVALIDNSNKRTELKLYDEQIDLFNAQRKQLKSELMPRLGAFVTGGYGRPGLNMMCNDFKAYYMAGLKLSVNIGNLYTDKGKKQIINNQIHSIENEREVFLLNTNIQLVQKDRELDKFREQIKYDNDICQLRSSVVKSSEAKMGNGTINGTELMRDVTEQQQAVQEMILHKIELLKAIYDKKYILNN